MKRTVFAKMTVCLLTGILLFRTAAVSGYAAEPETQYLQDFCDDPELDAWFEDIEENVPAELDFWIYGEGPYDMVFTDPELILETARALQTVQIGGLADEDPDNVSDAGGVGYYFTMEDGSVRSFFFIMGCFREQDEPWHDVVSFGDLPEVNEKLNRIGNPEYLYAYSDDDGFYTQYLETYQTDWRSEADWWGGLFIYTDEAGSFVEISRIEGDADPEDPEGVLEGYLADQMNEALTEGGDRITDAGELQEYEIGKETMPGIRYTLEDADGDMWKLLVLVLQTEDSLMDEPHLVRFCAAYRDGYTDAEETVMKALDAAVRNFHLKHMYYEQKDVQTDGPLLDFINDDGIRAWFAKAGEQPPEELTYVEDTWYIITDPEAVCTVLEAIQTVRIGGISDAHVGGSGRQIFDFMDESGNMMSFMFFEDTFNWEGESYEVLDWGDLEDLDLKGMASSSPGM